MGLDRPERSVCAQLAAETIQFDFVNVAWALSSLLEGNLQCLSPLPLIVGNSAWEFPSPGETRLGRTAVFPANSGPGQQSKGLRTGVCCRASPATLSIPSPAAATPSRSCQGLMETSGSPRDSTPAR